MVSDGEKKATDEGGQEAQSQSGDAGILPWEPAHGEERTKSPIPEAGNRNRDETQRPVEEGPPPSPAVEGEWYEKLFAEAWDAGYLLVPRKRIDCNAHVALVALRPVRVFIGAARDTKDMKHGDQAWMEVAGDYVGVEVWPL
jgi:hypothetical protein